MRGAGNGAPHRFHPWQPTCSRASARRTPAARTRRGLQCVGKAPLQLLLEGRSFQGHRQPPAGRSAVGRRAKYLICEGHGLPYPAPELEMELTNERDAHEPTPGDPAGNATRARADVGDDVVSDQIIGPLRWRADRK